MDWNHSWSSKELYCKLDELMQDFDALSEEESAVRKLIEEMLFKLNSLKPSAETAAERMFLRKRIFELESNLEYISSSMESCELLQNDIMQYIARLN